MIELQDHFGIFDNKRSSVTRNAFNPDALGRRYIEQTTDLSGETHNAVEAIIPDLLGKNDKKEQEEGSKSEI
ncbi:hypothetical protein K8942_05455 [Candidatus Peribacteria bacterium]|nr:MAG: hypothetical protein K8942_05455 [Candidatus Peribacteria bacterium]